LHFPGFDVLPSFVVYKTGGVNEVRFRQLTTQLGERLDKLWTDAPIPYRRQNGGDYEIPALTLKPELEAAGARGFQLHMATRPPTDR